MLVFLLTSIGARGFHSKEFIHDLNHHGQLLSTTLDNVYATASETNGLQKADLLDEIEHKLFHAVSTFYLLASALASFPWNALLQVLVPALSTHSLPRDGLESPFRPPRSSAFIQL